MIFLDDGTYRQQVFDMWQRNFQDPASYAEFYFREVYGKNEVLLNPEPGQSPDADAGEGESAPLPLRGMLHLNPYTLRIRGTAAEAAYIVGVATDPQFRRQGVMRELLRESFAKLRERGQCLTYLMPADEQYYLPFDFRFGMVQIEQELLYLPEKRSAAGEDASGKEEPVFLTEPEDGQLFKAAAAENRVKDLLFDIHTEISPEYLVRLAKEVGSEYGQIFYVYEGEEYLGRFAVDSENDYLILSQIFCVKKENRKEFLKQAVRYCSRKYHYTKYQVVADPSWSDVMSGVGLEEDIRFLPAKQVKKIMFRILNMEKLAEYLSVREDAPEGCREDVKAGVREDIRKDTGASSNTDLFVDIYIEDTHVKAQDGRYRFAIRDGKVLITKTAPEKNGTQDGGRIPIGDLTEYLFASGKNGSKKLNLKEAVADLPASLTQEGREILGRIEPLSENCIMEIV